MNLRRLFTVLVLLLFPSLATAAVRPWLAGAFGGATYSMSDVNGEIGNINALIAPTGLRMNSIDRGLSFGASGGADLGQGFSLGLGYDHLAANSKVADPTGSIEYDLPASLVRVLGRYAFTGSKRANGFLEASVGRVSAGGTVSMSATGSGSVSGDVEGSGLAFEGGGGVELWASPQFGFTGGVGFRHATIGEVTVDGRRVFSANGGDYSLDYSGAFARFGVLVRLTP